ncbi:MAG TPA: hypothetical protein VHE30_20845 [Polyangiaceae bacterium]|nr:hypothetical protein [Polyangiaceae bacterium]
MAKPPSARRIKGVNVVGLARFLRARRKTTPLGHLSESAEALLEERILASEWYPFVPFLEIVQLTYKEVLGESEAKALEMGTAGGIQALGSYHKGFVRQNDPVGTLQLMRTAWPMYFDFGELSLEVESPRSAVFTLHGYDDVTPGHAGLIVGWHVASLIVSGAKNAKAQVLARPWVTAPRLSHRLSF